METMRAVGVAEYGGPEVLKLVEVPRPVTGPGQIRIRVYAATVNPGDTVLRTGHLDDVLRSGPLTPPYIPGMEAAGVVDEIGHEVQTDLRPGDRVMTMVMPIDPTGGAYAEYLVVAPDQVTRAPAGSTHAEAATLPMNGLTARLALDVLDLAPGETVAVTGAAGAVGGYAIQLAKVDGLRVIADAAPADSSLVADLGADQIVARGDRGWRTHQAVVACGRRRGCRRGAAGRRGGPGPAGRWSDRGRARMGTARRRQPRTGPRHRDPRGLRARVHPPARQARRPPRPRRGRKARAARGPYLSGRTGRRGAPGP
ncbi:NADPH:quinone reductase related Zn-dependent oxidoreductase [Mycolicibacterium smegmatis MC2 155]|uniref:NADPH:quinone reductase related Zn-dependent oxidoreductase n=1 Tax=Mycolicibacterium smegmatis (strain ATCC 700084 / mc(2)155) TaxID=246196 RepID=I7G915_MYCS2|nr:NADPH:quinone reductase related Zn-dependent oxidoreductase [Mycolicibacterium smegmatis MC2 155]